jgi:protein tyrosine/serine phosphatase
MSTQPTSSRSRWLHWPACRNTRDLGGYPTLSGGHIRWGELVRSDSSALLTLPGQQALIDYGIRTVIDLRFPSELKTSPSPFNKAFTSPLDERPAYLNTPMNTDENLVWPSPAPPAELMSDMYCRILEHNRRHVAGVLSAIAHASPGGVLIHCHAGKDRTGLIVGVLLSALGVPKDVIAEDYALTYPQLEEYRQNLVADPSLTPDRRDFWRVLTSALPESMSLTMDYLDQNYAGAASYLRTTPLPLADLALLQRRMLE